MFNFVSSFGALASSSVTPIRKPTPPVSHQQGPSVPFEDTWPSLIDPKRRFVDNLHEQLSVSNAPAPPSAHPVPAFDNPDEETPITEPVQFKAASRLLQSARELEGTRRWSQPWLKIQSQESKTQPGPISQPQTIVVDVAQPLDDTQAPRDAVKSTAIALVRVVDSNFLPGTTIGTTHWIAYAVTKGRVRVIVSRSSGDRTLLKLPATVDEARLTDDALKRHRVGDSNDGLGEARTRTTL
ncbi:hypothetical protein EDB85DRAFT_2147698 [Lactarius pseudohatsudake]|nr:hypothetical protein EDB85DRAFT_2147698 [Lactarius pseudohatsudake]